MPATRTRFPARGQSRLFQLGLSLCLTWMPLLAQSVTIRGSISSGGVPVENAAVLFIDNSDTTLRYSTLSDAGGQYQLAVLATGIEPGNAIPQNFELAQNYPNPFNSTTTIAFQLKSAGKVQVSIYDILGREIRNLAAGQRTAGWHSLQWDGLDKAGAKVAAGIYFYRLQAGGESQVRKMILGAGFNAPTAILANGSAPRETPSATLGKETLTRDFTILISNAAGVNPPFTPREYSRTVASDTTFNFSMPLAMIVETDSTRQLIRGFGAANIVGWRPDMTQSDIDLAFGNGPGQLGFSILRLRISPNANDWSNNLFSATAAHNMGVTLMASPWTPPARMKTNNNLIGGRLSDTSYASYANHLRAFAEYMDNNGAPIYAVSVQNEPDIQVTYESCDWNGAEMIRFMRDYAPMVGVPVMCPESFQFIKTMSDSILNDSLATAHTGMIAGHIYGGGLEPYPLAREKGKELWMTEHLELATDWAASLATGVEINSCMTAGMNAYIWWYIVRFYGPIHEDGYVTKRGYVMSHFSRFIRPGFYRIKATEIPQRWTNMSAYTDGNQVVIVAINSYNQPIEQSFAVPGSTAGSFVPYVSTSTRSVEQEGAIPVENGIFTRVLEPGSITTFVSQ